MSPAIGIGGARRDVGAALAVDGRLVAACREERITRVRGVGSPDGRIPSEAINAVLELGHLGSSEGITYVVGEEGFSLPNGGPRIIVDHHEAHARSAFYTSGLDSALVLVCDQHSQPELSVWKADSGGLQRLELVWHGAGLATLYSAATETLGLRPQREEHKFEALARIGSNDHGEACSRLIRFRGDHLEVSSRLRSELDDWSRASCDDPIERASNIARSVEWWLGSLLVDLLGEIVRSEGTPNMCVAGGLFYNSYFNRLVQSCGLFESTFAPVDPGNPGLVAAAVSESGTPSEEQDAPVSPFLGTESSSADIKTTLDNCKLTYRLLDEDRLIAETVDALVHGHLVGWFQGRMEWGPRALGNRSILASPLSPYVTENLNVFLKHREPYRPYGVSVCEEDASRFFEGKVSSPYMECEYVPRALGGRVSIRSSVHLFVCTPSGTTRGFFASCSRPLARPPEQLFSSTRPITDSKSRSSVLRGMPCASSLEPVSTWLSWDRSSCRSRRTR